LRDQTGDAVARENLAIVNQASVALVVEAGTSAIQGVLRANLLPHCRGAHARVLEAPLLAFSEESHVDRIHVPDVIGIGTIIWVVKVL
jgi:hypothetical protein